jgi:hypothetical protein
MGNSNKSATPAPTSAPTPGSDNVSPDLAMAAQVAAANAAAPAAASAPAEPAVEYPAVARVRTTTGGTMVHLITNTVIGPDEKKIEIDWFAKSQIEAGKWVIVD